MTWFARDYTVKAVSGFDRFGFSAADTDSVRSGILRHPEHFPVERVSQQTGRSFGGSRRIGTRLVGLCELPGRDGNHAADFPAIQRLLHRSADPDHRRFLRMARQAGKEPLAPRKIGIGMVIAALGFVVLAVGSMGLPGTFGAQSDRRRQPDARIAELADQHLSRTDRGRTVPLAYGYFIRFEGRSPQVQRTRTGRMAGSNGHRQLPGGGDRLPVGSYRPVDALGHSRRMLPRIGRFPLHDDEAPRKNHFRSLNPKIEYKP